MHSDNEFRFLDLRQDWSWELSETQLPRWGFNVGDQRRRLRLLAARRAIFDPLITPVPIDTSTTTRDMDVRHAQARRLRGVAHAAHSTRLTAEAGARWDSYRISGEPEFDVGESAR